MILWAFEGPNGDLIDLTGADGVDETGPLGAWMPEYDLLTRAVPGGSGEIVEQSRAKPRQVTVPIIVQDPLRSGRALDDRLRALADRLAPEDGTGRLLATAADDDGIPILDPDTGFAMTRLLRARYIGGLEVTRSWEQDYGGWWQVAGLIFRADQPYYEPLLPRHREYRTDAPLTWFPVLPLQLGSDSLLGASSEVNDGAVDSFPVWTVHAPGSSFTATNVSTGQSFTVDTSGAGGLDIVVDTRPSYLGGGRSVTRADGANLYPQLTGALWPLARGVNLLQLVVADGTPGVTGIDLDYTQRYRTP